MVSHEGAWIKIAHQGQHAYVHGNYVDTKPAKKSAPEHVEAKPVGPAVDPAAKVATPPEVIKAVKHAAPEVAPQVEAQAKKPLAEVQAQSQTSGNQESTTAAATPESSSTETPAPAEHRQELEAEAARLLKEFDAGNLDHLGAVQRFTAFDEKATGHQTKAGQDVLLALIGALSEHEIRRKAAVAKANDE
jgi:hypothetical protein